MHIARIDEISWQPLIRRKAHSYLAYRVLLKDIIHCFNYQVRIARFHFVCYNRQYDPSFTTVDCEDMRLYDAKIFRPLEKGKR